MTGTGSSAKGQSSSSAPASSACRLRGFGAARSGVTVFDRGAAGSGATHAAAGMLAAKAEAEPGEEALIALNRASQKLWPAFADEWNEIPDFRSSCARKASFIALTADDQARLQHHLEFQHSLDCH